MKKRRFDRLFGVIAFIATPVFFISFSALIPCIFRNFYIWQIDFLKIPESSGYSKEVIIEAFNDVMDFIWKGAEFKTGQLAWTEAEKAHFADCVPLFWMQLFLAAGTGLFLLTYFILLRTKVLKRVGFGGYSPVSYGGFATLASLGAVGVFAAIDFNMVFVIFHKVFFPGKENWVFDRNTEEIINILPENFFLSCAIFIIGLAILLSILSIILGFVFKAENTDKMMKKLSTYAPKRTH